MLTNKKLNQAADALADRFVSNMAADLQGTDWIPEGALEPVQVEESAEAEIKPNQTLWEQFWSIFKHNKLALISLIIIIAFVVICVGAPVFAPHDPFEQDLLQSLKGPSAQHLLGCDKFGRDILSRMIYGGRVSLAIGLLPTIVSMFLGTVLGLIAGFVGGWVDSVIMRVADVVMAFPSILMAMVISYTIGNGILTIFVALSFVSWAGTARVIRSEVLSLREKEYVEAATSIGVKKSIIMFRHILPNCVPTLIVLLTGHIPGNILSESSLSFLGVGAQPPSTSWGLMVFQMKAYLQINPVGTLAPGVVILILVVAFNFLGDAIRDKLDPRLQEQ